MCLRSRQEQGLTTWPCGLGSPRLLETLQLSDDDDAVDEMLLEFSKKGTEATSVNASDAAASDGGLYTVVVLQKKNHEDGLLEGDSGFRTVVGKYRHAWISAELSSIGTVQNDVAVRIGDLAVNYFGGAKIGAADSKRTSMPLSADGEAILSFSLLNADPNDWIFDW